MQILPIAQSSHGPLSRQKFPKRDKNPQRKKHLRSPGASALPTASLYLVLDGLRCPFIHWVPKTVFGSASSYE